jgi:hypothetical protein
MKNLQLKLVPLVIAALCITSGLLADPVPVKYTEGTVHGYLAVKTLDGKLMGGADLIQTVDGDRVTSRLTCHYRDGSLDDELAIFSQRKVFHLISDHHIQKGPMFPKPIDVLIETASNQVTVRYRDKGKNNVETTHLDLPPDLANGVILNVLTNISPRTAETRLPYLVASPKPRLITISVTPEGEDAFQVAGIKYKAIRFNLHLIIGGIAGLIAPIIGKEPPDSKAWISLGEVPAFIRSEQPLYLGGPVLSTALISPVLDIPKTGKNRHAH